LYVCKLLRAELLDIEIGTDETVFFAGESDEEKTVLARGRGEDLKEAGKERDSAPVIDDAITLVGVIEVSSNDDGGGRGAGEKADEVGLFSGRNGLLG
jgi:hypothetical protein